MLSFNRRKQSLLPSASTHADALADALTVRRYRTDIPYLLPKDAHEASRLDFQHFALRSAIGTNYIAPITRIQKPAMLLDVGCGTGIWAHDLCREFSYAQVYGFDIEAIPKPDTPANYHFVEGNLLSGLPFKNNSFDFVHQRMLMFGIPASAWPEAINQLVRVTQPGGWVEIVEPSGTHSDAEGPVTAQMIDDLMGLAATRGIDTYMTASLEKLMEQSGLINIHKKVYHLPLGRWGGRIGALMATNLQAITGSFKEAYIKLLRYTPEYFDNLLVTMSREWEEVHARYTIYVYYGQKS